MVTFFAELNLLSLCISWVFYSPQTYATNFKHQVRRDASIPFVNSYVLKTP